MPRRNRPHILVREAAAREPYTPHPRAIGGGRRPPTPADPVAHAEGLALALRAVEADALARRGGLDVAVAGAAPGIYVQFDSHVDLDLELDSLENRPKHIELVALQEDANIRRATVFVPNGAIGHFLDRFEKYIHERTDGGERRHRDLVESIATLRTATLRALWTDDAALFPAPDVAIWWEIWLRRSDGNEVARLEQYAQEVGMGIGGRRLGFADRVVVLAHGTEGQLSASLDVLNDIAEARLAKQSPGDFARMPVDEQADWVREMGERLSGPARSAPAVCVLDTGANRGHPLLEGALDAADAHSIDPNWGAHDHDGHGTEMAGLALFGDLTPLLTGRAPVHLRHRLESVKILPPPGAPPNDPDLYGAVVAQAVSLVEIEAADRRRTFSMAVTAPDQRDRGQPTSWSAAIDALAAGRSFNPTTSGLEYLDGAEDAHRLFIISAGNVQGMFEAAHLARSDVEVIHDPGQAWNALTVGGYTDLAQVDLSSNPGWAGWSPLAPAGELSPCSCTGVGFQRTWPIKPDVVMEAGNGKLSASGDADFPADPLTLLTTNFEPATRLLVTTWATSAAASQAGRLAGEITAHYPSLWPETARALLVHSAEWTPQMMTHFANANTKSKIEALVRRYGFGVPSLQRAMRSANNALTLVVQDTISPFEDGKLNEWHIHDLPWPKDALSELFDAQVRLRVTLSYFVEPNPARRGWRTRHRYQSHGLRFDVKLPGESDDNFRRRLNQQALEGEDRPDGGGDSAEWLLGTVARHRGSIHSDVWTGTAARLAARSRIGIYPVSGWWKDLKKRDRSALGVRYALVVSIETDRVDVDIWTPVATQVGVPVEEVVEV